MAVGQQNKNSGRGGSLSQAFDGQAEGIANRGVLPSESQLCLVDEAGHRAQIKSQRCLQVGAGTKQNEPYSIALSALGKVSRNGLHRGDSRHQTVADLHILNLHAA